MALSFTYKRLSESNLKDLLYLMKTVHSTSKNLAYYQNKLNTSFTGHSYLGYFAYAEDGEPAAFYGVYPVILNNGRARILACQSGDTITNPKYQRNGLFISLAKKTYGLVKDEGIELVFGFPNENSAHGFFNKLGWTETPSFVENTRAYKTSNLYNLLHKFSFFAPLYGIYFYTIKQFFGRKQFNNSSSNKDGYVLERTSEYYAYKMNSKESFLIKINGFSFWGKFDNGVNLGDVEHFIPSEKNIAAFEKALRKLARVCGVKRITFYYLKGSFLDTILDDCKNQQNLRCGHLELGVQQENFIINYAYADSDAF